MTIGIPFDLSFQDSNVTDDTPTLDDILITCQAPVFSVGLELLNDEWIYEYQGVEFTPKEWNQTDETNGVYQIDEVLMRNCSLIKVTGKSGTGVTTHQRPKEPEDYDDHDISMKWQDWDRRYVKLPQNTIGQWLPKMYTDKYKQYCMVWSASRNKYLWHIQDTRLSSDGNHSSIDYGILWTGKYSSANDKKASVITWGGAGLSKGTGIRVVSMILRKGYFFLRTTVDAPIEYYVWEEGPNYTYSYSDVSTPADIDGFIEKRQAQPYQPFDGKNYTATNFDTRNTNGYAKWNLLTTQNIDSIALGKVMCDTVNFRISDQLGNKLFELNNYPIDNTLAPNRPEEYPATIILYTDRTYPAGSVVTVWLHGAVVNIGEIIGASRFDAGFTKLNFKNNFKDFSPKEQDQWGNWYYNTDGIKVHTHTGTVEYPVVSYDQLNRLMIMIGGQKIVINSSDSTENEVPDGRKVFAATMMIARFTKFELSTSEKNKRIGETATYNFSAEELV